jgi:hypothetical protein
VISERIHSRSASSARARQKAKRRVPGKYFIMASVVLMTMVGAAPAADFSDPDWPCIQRKVPHLSVGQMWTGPPIDEAALTGWRAVPGVAAIVPVLAARRTSMADAEALVASFAAQAGTGAEKATRLSSLFAGVFALIEKERAVIIAGIARYAHKQTGLAARIEAMRDELAGLKSAAQLDHDRIEELEDTIIWDERIFHDRAQSLAYVCETPVILEQRAFALARTLMSHID